MSGVVVAETVRRHVTNVFFLAYLALLAILSLGVSVFDRPASAWPSMITLLALIAGSGAIGPEFSSGTLQLILVKPITRAAYLLSRVAGIVLVVWIAATMCALFELAGRALWTDGVPFAAVGGAVLNVYADTILTVSLLAFLGSLTRAYFNIAIYMIVMAGISASLVVLGLLRQSANAVGAFLQAHTELDRALMAIDRTLFPELPPQLDERWMATVLVTAAAALVLSCLAFRRREVPYRAD